MRIGIGNDHAAVEMKNEIKAYLESKGYEVVNYGTDTKESCNYALIGETVGNAVVNKDVDLGICICGTGIGIGIAACKVNGVRTCTCSEPVSAHLSRLHNDSNVLCFGARIVGMEAAKAICDAWLETTFEGGRHQARIDYITSIEEKQK